MRIGTGTMRTSETDEKVCIEGYAFGFEILQPEV